MSSSEQAAAKNIDPHAKEIAMDLARKSGMTLGEWLTHMIVEGDDKGQPNNQNMSDQQGGQQQSQQQAQTHANEYEEDAEDLMPTPKAQPASPVFDRKPGESYYWRSAEDKNTGDDVNDSAQYFGRAGRADTEYESDLARITRALERMSNRIEAAEQRSAHAVNGLDRSLGTLISRLDHSEQQHGDSINRLDGAVDEIRTVQNQVSTRLKKIEASGGGDERSLEALKSLEAGLSKLASHMYESEAKAQSSIESIEKNLNNLSGHVDQQIVDLGEKIQEVIHKPVEPMEGANEMRQALSDVTTRLEKAEESTNGAIQSLNDAIAGLEEKIKTAGEGVSASPDMTAFEDRFEKLSNSLNEMVTTARADLIAKVEEAAKRTDVGQVDEVIQGLKTHIESAEARSAGAIDRLADEVARISGAMDGRISDIEGGASNAIETISTEVAKIADAIDTKFRATETKNVEAIERLGAELARVSDRLTERMVSAERRSTVVLDQVNQEMGKISDRLTQKYELASADLAERLRTTETKTEALLNEQKDRIDSRIDDKLSDIKAQSADMISPVSQSMADLAARLDHLENTHQSRGGVSKSALLAGKVAAAAEKQQVHLPVAEDVDDQQTPPSSAIQDDAEDLFVNDDHDDETVEIESAPGSFNSALDTAAAGEDVATPLDNDSEDELAVSDISPAHQFTAEVEKFDATDHADEVIADEEPEEALPIGATAGKDFLKSARESMQVVGQNGKAKTSEKAKSKKADKKKEKQPETAVADKPVVEEVQVKDTPKSKEKTTYAAEAVAPIDYPARSTAFDDLPPVKGGSAGGKAARMVVGGGLAIAAVSAAGYVAVSGGMDNALKNLGVDVPKPAAFVPSLGADKPTETVAAKTNTSGTDDMAAATVKSPAKPAVATPKPAQAKPAQANASANVTPKVPTLAQAAADGQPIAQYQQAEKLIGGGKAADGAAMMKDAAGAGLTPAQFKLATFYEKGIGVDKDMSQAFQWTERAAQGGHRKAMHNLGLYYYYGDGTAQNYEQAATWFKGAADLGNMDSQFNLGLLYEEGFGVKADNVEALKWYIIASNSGDAPALEKVSALAAKMGKAQVDQAKAQADAFAPKAMNAKANGTFGKQPWDKPEPAPTPTAAAA